MAFFLTVVFGMATIAVSKPNWKPLFNGQTLAPDWFVVGGNSLWTIDLADNAIVGASTTNNPYAMVFSTEKDFDQFTIKYSYRLKAGCSGFFFRSQNISAQELVAGPQVEAKFEFGGQREVGSLYVHPNPGWVVQHSAEYSAKISRPSSQYQDVILTVKKPFVYVNVNGFQTVGEKDSMEIRAGAMPAWNYTNSPLAQNPGRFGLQIHGGGSGIDIRYKNIMVLEGCGDTLSKGYDGEFVSGFSKHPAVYQDNNSCITMALPAQGSQTGQDYFGPRKQVGAIFYWEIGYPGAHTFEIITLAGKVLYAGSAPAPFQYHLSKPRGPGIYVARIKAGNYLACRKFWVP